MRSVLLVEDNTMLGRLMKRKMEKVLDATVYWTKSLKETKKLLDIGQNFSMALLDFKLPDAPKGEIIDVVIGKGITAFVFTAGMGDDIRDYVWSKKVADYIQKDDPYSHNYILGSMLQLEQNRKRLVLVVDDSNSYRTMLSELLYVRQFRVVNASDGQTALGIIANHPEISIVITDFEMPGIDGCTLCRKIRETRSHDDMTIIGMSSVDDKTIGARFLKSGADDFMSKHKLQVEEFYSRVDRCAKMMNLVAQAKKSAERDFLTGLYNRRYFFDAGTKLLEKQKRQGENLTCVMLDIDHFKIINDSYGHDIGDQVIKNIGKMITDRMTKNDIVARIGGEEYCVLTPVSGRSEIVELLERLRTDIETTPMGEMGEGQPIFVTCSMGVCLTIEDTLNDMVKRADDRLYSAKNNGRNRVKF